MTVLNKIACLDDDSDILFIAEMALQTVGNFQANLLQDPHHAMQQLMEISPDLLLLDVMMPEMDGPAVLWEMLQHPTLAKVPVIFMTARVQPGEINHYLALGAIGVIAKPFDPMTLASDIQNIWDEWNTRQHCAVTFQ